MKTLLLAALLLAPPAPQRQYIDVGSPDFRPLPLAVVPFQAEADARAGAVEVEQVLRDDLLLSGVFDLLDPKSFLADPKEGFSAGTIRFSRGWDVGAEGLVKARVKRSGDLLSAEFQLFEVRPGKEVLYRVYRDRSPRALAHRFADDIVQYYTREPGIFRTRIAAVRKQRTATELVLFDADGGNPEVVHREPGPTVLPAWRPDGADILFTGFRGGRPELWLLRLADRAVRMLVGRGELATGGAFSPDGRRLAFTVSADGNSDVWVANADGSDPRRLTTDPGTDTSPSWSPDGRRIAFVSNRSGNPHIYLMNADGSEQRRLTFQGNYNQTPRWSPRGDLIAFTARDERRAFDIFTVSPETGKVARVTQDQGLTNSEPSWAPNGRLLVFLSDRTGTTQLVVSTPSGDRQRVITRETAPLETPAWGPFPR
jgi:TolB protein